MKRVVLVLVAVAVAVALVAAGTGCRREPVVIVEETTVAPPSSASAPGTIPIGEFLAMVNTALGRDEYGEVAFRLDQAVAYESAAEDEMLYIFHNGDCEIVFFAGAKSGNFLQAYVRTQIIDDAVTEYMLMFAKVFMYVLEPNECSNIVESINAQFAELEASVDFDSFEDPDDAQSYFDELLNENGLTGYGEIWSMTYRAGLVNVQPK